jgi:hypothetical protein
MIMAVALVSHSKEGTSIQGRKDLSAKEVCVQE